MNMLSIRAIERTRRLVAVLALGAVLAATAALFQPSLAAATPLTDGHRASQSNTIVLGEEWFHPVTGELTAPLPQGIVFDQETVTYVRVIDSSQGGVLASPLPAEAETNRSGRLLPGEEYYNPVTGELVIGQGSVYRGEPNNQI